MKRAAEDLVLMPETVRGEESACRDGTRFTFDVDALRGGWWLLRGVLRRRDGDYDARLYFDRGEGFTQEQCICIPTSLKGNLAELMLLPDGVTRIAVSTGRTQGFEMGPLSLTRVGPWRRVWHALRRIVSIMWGKPRSVRKRVGLNVRRVVQDLDGAYRTASRLRAHSAAPRYADWVRWFDVRSPAECGRIRSQVGRGPASPSFNVAIAGAEDAAPCRTSRASLEQQAYVRFTVTSLDGAESLRAWNAALATAAPEQWVVLVRAGDALAPHALAWFASVGAAQPDAAIIYADEDELDSSGARCNPAFKPDWSWAHARETRFTGAAVAIRARVLARAGGLGPDDLRHGCYDAVLRALDAAAAPDEGVALHIPAVLLHRGPRQEDAVATDAWSIAAVQAHLQRRGVAAEVTPTRTGCWHVRYRLPDTLPLVSVVVPTRDALELTRRCVQSVLERTRYARLEILLVDNQSSDPQALDWMRAMAEQGRVRLLHYDQAFNFSAINNMAVREARGEVVCLLNNDTEVITPDWLDEMVGQLLQDRVAVVGAKLLYPDGRVQHGGDLVGVGGVANHAHAYLGRDEPGYCNRAVVAQDLSAVTAACMLTWRDRYLQLGGLDERHLPVAFNDVDYCLRVREAGWRVVWTPHALLYHHESVSRGPDRSPQQQRRARREAKYMRKRWRHVLGADPFYNPNLSLERADFSLSHAPLVCTPWQP